MECPHRRRRRICSPGVSENSFSLLLEERIMIETAQLESTAIAATARPPEVTPRLISMDAFRGLVMTLMLGEVMHLPEVARSFPQNWLWNIIAFNTQHVEWQGCSLHDLIQPAFSFLVGTALPFSIASRKRKGQAFGQMLGHTAWRALLLIVLGIFLRSLRSPQTYFTFEDTLTQIGLGYVFLFLLAFTRVRTQVVALVLILICFWAAFTLYPVPGPDFDYARVGVPQNWALDHNYTGFLSHFNKNSNLSWRFDVWFLNLFPRQRPFVFNEGGWSTLSFVPTLGTMIMGLLAGEWLKGKESKERKLRGLVIAGAALVLLGLIFQWAGICPIVKRVWTSAYTLYSGGLVVLILAGFYALIELRGLRRWAFPLIVVGMNSIAAYLMSWTMGDFFGNAIDRHIGKELAAISGPALEPMIHGLAVLLIFWLILFWMYRRKIFLRI
jgi:heparan-alpha-glucosaminide N-acetyltransferase